MKKFSKVERNRIKKNGRIDGEKIVYKYLPNSSKLLINPTKDSYLRQKMRQDPKVYG